MFRLLRCNRLVPWNVLDGVATVEQKHDGIPLEGVVREADPALLARSVIGHR